MSGPEDEVSVEPEADASEGDATGEGAPAGDDVDDANGSGGEATTEPEEDEGPSAISERLMTELTAHRTLGLRHALGEHPDVPSVRHSMP